MKKSTKKFTGSIATLATVASIIAPSAAVFAAEASVQDLVSWAEQTKNFYDFNMAFAKVLSLPAAEQPAYLARLAVVENVAKTPEIKAVLKTMDELVANKDLGNYVKLEQLINTTITESKNNLYLRGELTTWGKGMVYTADVNAAIAAVNNAWTLKTPASVASAKLAAANVANAGSQAWLVGQIAEVQKTMAAYVEGVTSLSATQVSVKFSKAVDKATLFDATGAFKTGVVSFTSLDLVPAGTLSGKLSADGTVLTVTALNNLQKRYDVVVDGLKTTDGATVSKYSEMVTIAADKTAPVVVSTAKLTASTFKVVFSEPISDLGSVTYKLADGTFVSGTGTGVTNDFARGAKEVIFTLGADVDANKTVTATFVGTQDMALNLLTPNPATVSFVKGDKDGVAPVVTSVAQTDAKTFAVKFSEELLAAPTVTVSDYTVSSVAKDANNSTVYNVTVSAALAGVKDVNVSNFADLSGEAGTTVSKIVTFVKDEVAPKAVSSVVVVDELDRKEYLEVTFDKDVELTSTASVSAAVSYVKDYVTTDAGTASATVAYKAASNKKVVRVDLATLLLNKDVESANYTLNLTFTGVANGAGIAVEAAKATFTRGEDGTAANETVLQPPTVRQGADNNKVEVVFPSAVDGASAVNVANYKIDGAVVQSVTLNPVVDGKQIAVLNLQAGSNGFTGVRNINIANVKALGSIKTMAPYFTNAVSLKENVAPVVTSAKLTSTTTIKLTFSEAVKDTAAVTEVEDFEVLVGGKAYATPVTRDLVAATTGVTTVTITIPAVDSTVLASGLSLKALTSLDTTDLAGNKLSVPANIVVTQ